MPELTITFTKRRDGSVVTRFDRADGSATWQRKHGAQATYFGYHDLTHFAVETTLGYQRGFYGLIAEGFDVNDLSAPLPGDQDAVEVVVGFLDREQAMGEQWSASQFNENAALHYSVRGLSNPPVLDDATLTKMREHARALQQRWTDVREGESMVLSFTRHQQGGGFVSNQTKTAPASHSGNETSAA